MSTKKNEYKTNTASKKIRNNKYLYINITTNTNNKKDKTKDL